MNCAGNNYGGWIDCTAKDYDIVGGDSAKLKFSLSMGSDNLYPAVLADGLGGSLYVSYAEVYIVK
jgi:hypothetical protein